MSADIKTLDDRIEDADHASITVLEQLAMSREEVVELRAALEAASPLREANARRAGACWNVCEGMSTDSLENMPMLGATMRSRFTELKAECDTAYADLSAARALLAEVLESEDVHIAERITAFLAGGAA